MQTVNRERLEREAARYADAHCTDDKDVLSRWMMSDIDRAFRYMKFVNRDEHGSPYGLFDLLLAGYWKALYDRKLKELELEQ